MNPTSNQTALTAALHKDAVPRGKLIVFEGPDGAGKSTLLTAVSAALAAAGVAHLKSREPTFGPHGQALREAAKTCRLPPEQELELLLLDRHAHVGELIEPGLARGDWVLLDRYYFSTIAYQGAAGLDQTLLRARNEAFAPQPDLLFLLDLPLQVSLQRIRARGLASDDFETPETLRKVREIFLSFSTLPYAVLLDAQLPPAVLATEALNGLNQRFTRLAALR